jgi:large subunit ribosomal protein L20
MRVTNAPASRKRRKRMLTAAKGYRGRRSKLYRYASDAVDHGLKYQYRDRKNRKRTFRYLWQIRINAATRAAGMTYSRFIEGLKAAQCTLDRKVLADIAATDAAAFSVIIEQARAALATKAAAPKQAVEDLTKIEGIGPKINELMKAAGITAFAQLAATSVERLKEILAAAGPRFRLWDPTTWPEQAALAAKGDWEAFKKLTDELDAGRRV